ncbi:hypothetical protein NQ318_018302 [Aromia moschata]|uniref:Peptidase S1 domain-containing protein n=1 Tax=Aromia moschata TaxID=1265417 RepID=A0AAV8ZG08_9CUCU|nr:hypothetical protein NQ318_018302 [Aromia moschata]
MTGNYEGILQPNESKQVLIKNGDVLLKAGSQTVIKITVKYSGKFPELLEYRLNAKTICPEPNTERVDFFKGDEHSKDILTSILSSPMSTILNQKSYECGVKSLRSSKYPWQADIFIRHGDTVNFACEATLISPLHLITSAHCVTFKNKDIEVPASILTVHLRDPHDSKDVNRATVAKVKVHPGYNLNTLFSDIAVLQLNDALAVTDGVRPICLSGKLSYDGELVLTGYEVGKRGDHRDELKETAVSRIDENVCSKRAPELQRIIGEDTYCVTYPSGELAQNMS